MRSKMGCETCSSWSYNRNLNLRHTNAFFELTFKKINKKYYLEQTKKTHLWITSLFQITDKKNILYSID